MLALGVSLVLGSLLGVPKARAIHDDSPAVYASSRQDAAPQAPMESSLPTDGGAVEEEDDDDHANAIVVRPPRSTSERTLEPLRRDPIAGLALVTLDRRSRPPRR